MPCAFSYRPASIYTVNSYIHTVKRLLVQSDGEAGKSLINLSENTSLAMSFSNMKNFLFIQLQLLLCGIYCQATLIGQAQPWTPITAQKLAISDTWPNLPNSYLVFSLDQKIVKAKLKNAPDVYEGFKPVEVSIPSPTGQVLRFAMTKSVTLPPELAHKYPQIRTYQGVGIDDPSQRICLELTPKGLHAMIRMRGKTAFLEPHSETMHLTYWEDDFVRADQSEIEFQIDDWSAQEPEVNLPSDQRRGIGGDLLLYRIAIAGDEPFTAFHGGVSNALAAIAVILNRMNSIYEREAGIQFQLIPNNDLIIFDGPDPYTQGTTFLMGPENQVVLDNVIGDANYDLGMVFSHITTGGGYSAQSMREIVCKTGSKGSTWVGSTNPVGDPFAIRGVAKMMGHQFSATNTFNTGVWLCVNDGVPSSAYEPGSGSTFMSYAGYCSPDIIVPTVDDYYHGGSLEQIHTYSRIGLGSTCPTTISSSNQYPIVSVDSGGFFIPTSTSFELIGNAMDPDGDSLTYCWEQMDLGPAGSPNFPVGNAPLFRSFPPRPESNRIFPQIESIISNQQIIGEILPDYGRDMNFRLTVRDQVGGVEQADIEFQVDGTSGPFLVTYPDQDALPAWIGGTCKEILWDVANTDGPIVNCQYVNILLSLDGGYTYPYTLAEQIANDGSALITVPELTSDSCRVKVQASNNVFFDISNHNFSIELASQPGISMYTFENPVTICKGDTARIKICTAAQLGFADSMELNIFVIPEFTAHAIPDIFVAGDTLLVELSGGDSLASGSYLIGLTATSLTSNIVATITLGLELIESVEIPQLAGFTPLSAIPQGNHSIPFSWEATSSADRYHFEIATSPVFGSSIIYSNEQISSDTFTLPISLLRETAYYWRVRGINTCVDGPDGMINAFHTGACEYISSSDVPLQIPFSGNHAIVNSTINASSTESIDRVRVFDLVGEHTSIEELSMHLISPMGTEVTLLSHICTDSTEDFDLGFADGGIPTIDCPPTLGKIYQPTEVLSTFAGEIPSGNWTLSIRDHVNFNTGELQSWALEICDTEPNRPELIQNQGLQTQRWHLDTLDHTLLVASDGSSNSQQIVYTILTLPQHGGILLNGNNLSVGDSFLQADLYQQAVAYLHNGSETEIDSFRFDLKSPNGSWNGVFDFLITIEKNLTTEIASDIPKVNLHAYPNPTEDELVIEIEGLNEGEATLELYAMQGQLMMQETHVLVGGKLQTSLMMNHLSSGLYLLRVASPEGDFLRRIVKK